MSAWSHGAPHHHGGSSRGGPRRNSGYNSSQFVTCRGKGSCGYQWTWSSRSRCHRCNRWVNELPVPPRSEAEPVRTKFVDINFEAALVKKFGDDNPVLSLYRQTEKAQRAERLEAKPTWTQHKELSQTLEKRRKALETAKQAVLDKQEYIKTIQKELAEQESNVASILVDIASLEKQVSASAVRAASTCHGTSQPDPRTVLEALLAPFPEAHRAPLAQLLGPFYDKFKEVVGDSLAEDKKGYEAEEEEEEDDGEKDPDGENQTTPRPESRAKGRPRMEVDEETRKDKDRKNETGDELLDEALAFLSATPEQLEDPTYQQQRGEYLAKLAENRAKRQRQG